VGFEVGSTANHGLSLVTPPNSPLPP